jgi:hypothetical protein
MNTLNTHTFSNTTNTNSVCLCVVVLQMVAQLINFQNEVYLSHHLETQIKQMLPTNSKVYSCKVSKMMYNLVFNQSNKREQP